MNSLAVLGMLAGYIWGVAGVLAYPGISWKPGAIITVACAAWLLKHDAMPAEPYIEAGAILTFLVLSFARERLVGKTRGERSGS